MIKIVAGAFIAALAAFPLAYGDDNHGKKGHGGHSGSAQGASAQDAAMADGEVRRVDKDAKKITIRHGPLPSLDMPAMTMVFQVTDAGMLDQVKAGDKVKFQAEKVGGAYRITRIQPGN